MKRAWLLVGIWALCLFGGLAWVASGADDPAATVTAPAAATETTVRTPKYAQVLVAVGGPIVTAVIKFGIPHIPKAILPWLPVVLGALVDGFVFLTANGPAGWGTFFGAIAVWLREAVDQLKKAAVGGP